MACGRWEPPRPVNLRSFVLVASLLNPYQNGHRTPLVDNPTRLGIFIPNTGTHSPGMTLPKEPGSGLTASAPVSCISAPACTNGVRPPLRPVSVAQKNKPSTMLSSNVQSTDLLMDCTVWRFWTMGQPNDCSTPAPKSSAAKQWIEKLAQKKKKNNIFECHKILIQI